MELAQIFGSSCWDPSSGPNQGRDRHCPEESRSSSDLWFQHLGLWLYPPTKAETTIVLRRSPAHSGLLLQPLGPQPLPLQGGNCHQAWGKPWITAGSGYIPSIFSLMPHHGDSCQCTLGECIACPHFRFSSPTKTTGQRQTARGHTHIGTHLQHQDR